MIFLFGRDRAAHQSTVFLFGGLKGLILRLCILATRKRVNKFPYHCTDGTLDSQSIRTPFREMVAPLLADQRFYLCGTSFVLNFQHVTRVQGQNAMLDSGQTVPLPRAAAADFKKAWGNYWLAQTHEG